jgi:hypothetical protein
MFDFLKKKQKTEYVEKEVWQLQIVFKRGNDVVMETDSDQLPNEFEELAKWHLWGKAPTKLFRFRKGVVTLNRSEIEYIYFRQVIR